MKREMIKSLKSRFAGIEENRLLSIATILDPRFKEKFFASNIIKMTVKEMLEEEIRKIAPNDNEDDSSQSRQESSEATSRSPTSPVQKHAKKDTLLILYSEIIEDSGASSSNSADELEQFLSEPLVDYKAWSPFKWWHENKTWFPTLAQVARRFLSGITTSVPSERLFSQAMKSIEIGFFQRMQKRFFLSKETMPGLGNTSNFDLWCYVHVNY